MSDQLLLEIGMWNISCRNHVFVPENCEIKRRDISKPRDYRNYLWETLPYCCRKTTRAWIQNSTKTNLQNRRTVCHKISWSPGTAQFGFRLLQWLWNRTGISTAALLRCLLHFKRYDNYTSQFSGFETSWDLVVRRLSLTRSCWPLCQ